VDDGEDLYSQFADEQARGYAEHAHELRSRGRALPGAAEALGAFADRDDVIQSVLTGNTRPVSEIKLRTFGLDRCLDFDSGAYGTDDENRSNLVKIARQHAEAVHRIRFDPKATVLIGDTPNDVAATPDGSTDHRGSNRK
jgi:phosphoglycolate phosphatase